MTLAISMLKNIFPLHTIVQDYVFHLKKLLVWTNVIILTNSGRDTLIPVGIM